MNDARRHSPAADRNKQPILEILQRVLPESGLVLEIASGTGQHAAWFAGHLPAWTWQPTDADPDALPSIAAWAAEAGLANVRPPLHLDVMAPAWLVTTVDAVFCANMLHIAPWATCAALMRGAARHLAPQGLLVLYGPYLVDGQVTAPSNLAFDADLHSRNPAWGLRRLADVAKEAREAGLELQEQFAMPANNLTLVFRRAAAATSESA